MRHLDQRRAELIRRRLAGDDFESLAQELDYPDTASAAAAFAAALDDADPLEPAARHQADQHSLDELQHAIWHRAAAGDLDAIAATLAILDSRERRLGLGVPARLDSTGTLSDPAAVTDDELEELLALIEDPPI
ncbi:hypothetical protein ACFUIW_33455 [Streptomyces sp. NPDC057245]|uniref:hypothetical protein n=1 Tax=Streptomyces sp. NPDC057245 TaxID=3346065 RepID=UPI00363F1E9D